MTDARFKELMEGDNTTGPHMTPEEWAEGWHFCHEFDGLLRKNEPQEEFICTCRGDGK